MDFVIGGLAGAGATVFTNPMDVVKTRLQLQGELTARKAQISRYKGIFHGIYVIAKADGLMALQKGLVPAMTFGFFMNSIRLGTFRIAEMNGWTKTKEGDISISRVTAYAGMSGFISGVLANPMSVIKTRLQSAAHASVAVGKQHQYKGTIDAIIKINRVEGLRGFFAGVNAACYRLTLGSGAQLSSFSLVKEILHEKEIFRNSPLTLAFVSSLSCGVICAILESPFDVIGTRLYNQGPMAKGEHLYNGLFDCFKKILRTEGIYGFYKGIGPLYLRIAPHTTLSLVFWDMLKIVFENKER